MVEDSVPHGGRQICQLGEYDALLLGGGHPGDVIPSSFNTGDGLIVDLNVEPVESRESLNPSEVSSGPNVLTNLRQFHSAETYRV